MISSLSARHGFFWLCGLALMQAAPLDRAQAKNLDVLVTFTGQGNGGSPYGGLTKDKAGNLYGTTVVGGQGYGTIFRIDPSGTETVLYSFQGGQDGANPYAGIVSDGNGNFYGVTQAGGGERCEGGQGCGTVFKLASDGTETVLHVFAGKRDGKYPHGGLVRDSSGNLFGTTLNGGAANKGVVFEIAANGKETILHDFLGSDGENPFAGLIADGAGNLYGTTSAGGGGGGCSGYGCGTLFRLAPGGTETVFHTFSGGSDGVRPYTGLIVDKSGNFYGTTSAGGGVGCGGQGCGTVFEFTSDGRELILYAFSGGRDGASPAGSIAEKAGNIYGATTLGGTKGYGAVFKIAADGSETTLRALDGASDGAYPLSGVIAAKGHLFGVSTSGGGYGYGTLFSLKQ